MKIIKPNLIINRYNELTYDQLKKEGITLLICDIDNTLVGYDEALPNEEVKFFIKSLNDIKVILVSNNVEERCRIFSKPLNIDYIAFAQKPTKKAYLQILKQYPNEKIACLGDQIFTDIVGGNRFKLYTIKTAPIKEKDSFVTLFSRTLEKLLKPIWSKK